MVYLNGGVFVLTYHIRAKLPNNRAVGGSELLQVYRPEDLTKCRAETYLISILNDHVEGNKPHLILPQLAQGEELRGG